MIGVWGPHEKSNNQNSVARGPVKGCSWEALPFQARRLIWCQAGGLSQEAPAPMYMVSAALASLGVLDLRFRAVKGFSGLFRVLGLGFWAFRV